MLDPVARVLEAALVDRFQFGQVLVEKNKEGGFGLSHRDDAARRDIQPFRRPDDAVEIAKFDDAGKYRPLKTAPNLRHGWRLEVGDSCDVRRALDHFYPGRLAVFAAWKENRLAGTSLRETLDRQSGMYRVAAKISDEQIDDVVENFCRSDGGCLRTILWKRDASGATPSARLPPGKFATSPDQARLAKNEIPLLCQEACNLLVAECRKVVKSE